LFARRGLYQVTVREIVEAAGQRNVSALNYHFGSREGVLDAILDRHGERIDAERGVLLKEIGRDASSRDLVGALVVPYLANLGDQSGRDYLRIVAQLSARFSTWRDPGSSGTGPWLVEILGILEERAADASVAVRRERVVELIMLMTAAASERARAVESKRPLELDDETFAVNLTDVLVAVLEARRGGPLRAVDAAAVRSSRPPGE
jgi:AcrR family transcriptional regulator